MYSTQVHVPFRRHIAIIAKKTTTKTKLIILNNNLGVFESEKKVKETIHFDMITLFETVFFFSLAKNEKKTAQFNFMAVKRKLHILRST